MTKTRQFINGLFDPIFKAIFTGEDTKEYVARIINIITEIPYEEIINNMVILNNEITVNNKKDKKMRTDLLVSIEHHLVNIELNKDYYDGLIEKNNAYQTKILGEQFESGKDYKDIKCVVQINFDNFEIFKTEEEIHKCMIMDVKSLEVENEYFIKYHVNLEKIKKECYNKSNHELTKLEKYCMILMANTKDHIHDVIGDDCVLKKVANKLENLNEDEKIIGLYDGEKVDKKIMNTKLLYVEKLGLERGMKKGMKQGIEKGMKQGMEKGMKQGMEKGMGKGMEKGMKQGIEQTAINMLHKNIDVSIISECTGLTIEEIKKM